MSGYIPPRRVTIALSGSELGKPIRMDGNCWRVNSKEYSYATFTGGETSVTINASLIPKRSAPVTDKWTGRKYRGVSSGGIYEILCEPFDCAGVAYVAFRIDAGGPNVAISTSFLSERHERIIEPAYKVGDRVDSSSETLEIVAVSPKQDRGGQFVYLCLGSDGEFDSFPECYLRAAA